MLAEGGFVALSQSACGIIGPSCVDLDSVLMTTTAQVDAGACPLSGPCQHHRTRALPNPRFRTSFRSRRHACERRPTRYKAVAIIEGSISALPACVSIARRYTTPTAARSAHRKPSDSSRGGSRSIRAPRHVSPKDHACRCLQDRRLSRNAQPEPRGSRTTTWLRRGGILMAAGYLARWGWIAAQQKRTSSTAFGR